MSQKNGRPNLFGAYCPQQVEASILYHPSSLIPHPSSLYQLHSQLLCAVARPRGDERFGGEEDFAVVEGGVFDIGDGHEVQGLMGGWLMVEGRLQLS